MLLTEFNLFQFAILLRSLVIVVTFLQFSWIWFTEISIATESDKIATYANSLIGKNFFRLFTPNVEFQASKESKKIFDQNGVYLEYFPASFGFPASAQLRVKGIKFNLFYFKLDDQQNILSVSRIDSAGIAPDAVIPLVANLKGVQDLANHFGISTNCDPELNSKLLQMQEKKAQNRQLEESIVPLAELNRVHRMDSDDAIGVLQHEFAITSFGIQPKKKGIKTFGAGPCVIVTIYDRKNKVGMLAHVDALTEFEQSMSQIAKLFRSEGGALYGKGDKNNTIEPGQIEISLIGGDQSTKIQIHTMRQFLVSSFQYSSFKQDILTGDIETAWLDLEGGKISKFTVNPSLKSNEIPPLFGMALMSAGKSPLKNASFPKKLSFP